MASQAICQNSIEKPLEIGKPNADAKIEVFYDLQCPTCANFHSILKSVEDRFRDKVFVTFRHFPLGIPAHDKAFLAARVVEAARLQGKGLKMLDLILANQRKWTAKKNAQAIFYSYAPALKLNIQLFRDDFESDAVIQAIVRDIERAHSLKLNSVPTIFVNGKEISFVEALDLGTVIEKIVK